MTNIEKLLARSDGPRPRRRLRIDFTQQVIARVSEHPPKRGWSRVLEIKYMKFFTKPALASAAIVLAVVAGGTAYAAVGGWPGIAAIFGGQQKLPNGDRIVKVDTQNCNYASAFTMTAQDKSQHTIYYKVKADSKLTNDQVVQTVRGNCYEQQEADFGQQTIQKALNANPLNKDSVVGGYIDSEVTAIGNGSISLKSIVPYGGNAGTELKTISQTFKHIDPNVLVYASPNTLRLADIHVGDHVSIEYRASGDALKYSESIAPDKVNPDEQVVVVIIKNTGDTTAAINYSKYNGSEFEQVTPCSTQSIGYCTYQQTQQ